MSMLAESGHVEKIIAEIGERTGPGQRAAFVSGNFNVLHPGHLRLLRFAAENGDILVVGVNPDNAPGVTVPADMRLEGVRSNMLVDYAFLLDEPPHAFIARLKPEIVVRLPFHGGGSRAQGRGRYLAEYLPGIPRCRPSGLACRQHAGQSDRSVR